MCANGAEIARAKTILSALTALDSKAINFGRLYGDSRNLSHEAGRHWLRYIWHVTDFSDSTRLKWEARITELQEIRGYPCELSL